MTDKGLYYVRRQGRVDGPWPVEKLRSEVQMRKLARYHHLSLDGKSWFPAGNVDALFPKVHLQEDTGSSDEQPHSSKPTWYYAENNNAAGPVHLHELVARLRMGKLSPGDLVWREGMAEWQPAGEIPELAPEWSAVRQEIDDVTAQTRMVTAIVQPKKRPVSVGASFAVAGMVALLSCVPAFGLLGIVPLGMGVRSLVRGRTEDRWIAVSVVVIGTLEVICGVVTALAFVGYYLS